MKRLLNTVYVMNPGSYISLRNETISVQLDGRERNSVPAKDVDGIVCFGKMTISTPLIGLCGERGITITLLTEHGKFCGRICGPVSGNVLLRRRQYRSMDDDEFCRNLVRDVLFAKLRNSREVLLRHARKAEGEAARQSLGHAAELLTGYAVRLAECESVDAMRGVEGAAASAYFGCFDDMLRASDGMRFEVRSRHPPQNEVNAVLSFVYTLLTREARWALEAVGLDPEAGYLHALRPGRLSLALDMIEELRAQLCDRLVLSMFNRGQLTRGDFDSSSRAVLMNDKGRKMVLGEWQNRKREFIQHPFLGEKVEIGMIIYAQAMLLARVLRGDLDRYPPFIWR